jgi:magnesium-transporting ATPase (P-type)
MLNRIYQIGLIVFFIFEWGLMYQAKHEEYDANYGLAIYAFLLSLIAIVLLLAVWFLRRDVIKSNRLLTVIYLITSSPLSIFLFVEFYGRFIGQYFKL